MAIVTATDQEGLSEHAGAATGPVAKPPVPSATSEPVISGIAQEGHALKTGTGTWASPDKLRFSDQWQRCEPITGNCTAIRGATHTSYLLTSGDVGKQVSAAVRATDRDAQTGHATAAPVGPITG